VLNGLPLRIENRAFRHHPYVCGHVASITLAVGVRPNAVCGGK
jgi:hypothetical protein